MMRKLAAFLFLTCAACLPVLFAAQPAGPAAPPYAIVLRSRDGAVTPLRSQDAQTGGGFIQVTRVEPNAVMAWMHGTVAAGSVACKDGAASMQFHLHQDFEIVPTRANLGPPRLVLAAWLIGGLNSTPKEGGSASYSTACAAVQSGENAILHLCVKPHAVGGGENLLINDRVGPLEIVAAPGGYCLDQTFTIDAAQPKSHCHHGAAAADFDPSAKLDSRWDTLLKPFRAAPHTDFGFRVILRVVEDTPSPSVPIPPEVLPQPRQDKLPAEILGEAEDANP